MGSEGSSSSSVRSEILSGPVLVTGAGGYLGGRVIGQLRANGIESLGLARGGGSDLACDLLDAAGLRDVVDRTVPRVVVHCAAAVPRNAAGYDDAEAGTDSVRMVQNLIDAGVTNIVFASSMTVYRPGQRGPLREDRADPQSAYGRAKFEAEALLASANGCSAVALRLPGLFGPPRRKGLVYALCEAIRKGRTPTLPAQPLMWSAMHVDDAASTMVRAALRPPGPGFVSECRLRRGALRFPARPAPAGDRGRTDRVRCAASVLRDGPRHTQVHSGSAAGRPGKPPQRNARIRRG